MVLSFIKKHSLSVFCGLVICVYLISIMIINFSGIPTFYSTDMYSDMCYAQEVWEHKSIFPEGWVFGNQFYVVATPVLAALFYGLFGNAALAMGMASTLMGIFVLLSFDWMLKAVFPKVQSRLLGAAVFMSLMLSYGGPVQETDGWQLLFTMCSFYACYAITAFLAFGCYIRGSKATVPAIVLCCVMSFCTGMQSLRQTAIMLCPLIGIAFLCMLRRSLKSEKLWNHRTTLAGLISLTNLFGLLFIGMMHIPQVEIFGDTSPIPVKKALDDAYMAFKNAFSMIASTDKITSILLVVIGVFCVLFLSYKFYTDKKPVGALCICLLGTSIAGILFLDIFTTMNIRNIYYFLIYPLIAFIVVFLYHYGGKWMRCLLAALLIVTFISGAEDNLSPVLQQAKQGNTYGEVVAFLEENGITTVFSGWNRAENIAIASGDKIKAGFWDGARRPFRPVNYLCNPEVFDVAPEKCAYIFFVKAEAQYGEEAAKKENIDFTLLKHFPGQSVYIYVSSVNIMAYFNK